MTAQYTRTAPIRTFENLMLVDGPAKDGLEEALFDRKPRLKRVSFVAARGLVFEAMIIGVSWSENEPGFWDIEGCALEPQDTVTVRNWRDFKICFNTDTRQGTFQYITKGAELV